MKLLQEIYQLIAPSSTDKGSEEMKYPNAYKVKDIGAKTKVKKKTVVVRRSSDGRIYGRRTIFSK